MIMRMSICFIILNLALCVCTTEIPNYSSGFKVHTIKAEKYKAIDLEIIVDYLSERQSYTEEERGRAEEGEEEREKERIGPPAVSLPK